MMVISTQGSAQWHSIIFFISRSLHTQSHLASLVFHLGSRAQLFIPLFERRNVVQDLAPKLLFPKFRATSRCRYTL